MCVLFSQNRPGVPPHFFPNVPNVRRSSRQVQPSNVQVTLNAVLSICDGCHVVPWRPPFGHVTQQREGEHANVHIPWRIPNRHTYAIPTLQCTQAISFDLVIGIGLNINIRQTECLYIQECVYVCSCARKTQHCLSSNGTDYYLLKYIMLTFPKVT